MPKSGDGSALKLKAMLRTPADCGTTSPPVERRTTGQPRQAIASATWENPARRIAERGATIALPERQNTAPERIAPMATRSNSSSSWRSPASAPSTGALTGTASPSRASAQVAIERIYRAAEIRQEPRGREPINAPMVEGQREAHDWPRRDLAVLARPRA